jgi:hypothetical protein
MGIAWWLCADEGVDLNAYYDRNGLHFFHGSARATVYSGESPDVVCHELDTPCLMLVKPQLWTPPVSKLPLSMSHSVIERHSQQSAAGLMRDEVLTETDGQVATASRLSRLAEDLGWAIRQLVPDGVADCLRSAVNSLYYQAPASLPPRAPAVVLSSEPHSFSRVFTAGFFRMLGRIFHLQPQQNSDGLLKAAQDAGKLLIEGVRRSPVVPAFYSQVAAHMVAADAELFNGKYRTAIRAGFVGTGVLSVPSAAELGSDERLAAAPEQAENGDDQLPRISLTGSAYRLPSDLFVRAASQPRRFGVASGTPDTGDAQPPAADQAARSFVEDLVRRGRIAVREEDTGDAPIIPSAYTTHEIQTADGARATPNEVRLRLRDPLTGGRTVDDMTESERSEETDEAERRFAEDLAARGEAVPQGTEPLPPGATHEIEEERDGVPTKVRRRRFSSH